VGPVGEAAAVFQPPAPRARRGERGGGGWAALGRKAGAGPTAGREGGKGRLGRARGGGGGWAAREGEGATGPRARGRGRLGRKGRRGGEERRKRFSFFFKSR
jgi:hypothetical protein